MVKEISDFEQLMYLKDLTKNTGILHEAQVLQLKYWPLMVTHGTHSEFTFNFNSQEVIFNITQTKGRAPKELKDHLSVLEKSVQELLGDDYRIRVMIKNKVIYDGTRQADGSFTGT